MMIVFQMGVFLSFADKAPDFEVDLTYASFDQR